jgi:hypothetical protein
VFPQADIKSSTIFYCKNSKKAAQKAAQVFIPSYGNLDFMRVCACCLKTPHYALQGAIVKLGGLKQKQQTLSLAC